MGDAGSGFLLDLAKTSCSRGCCAGTHALGNEGSTSKPFNEGVNKCKNIGFFVSAFHIIFLKKKHLIILKE